jgi:hypothetical protein
VHTDVWRRHFPARMPCLTGQVSQQGLLPIGLPSGENALSPHSTILCKGARTAELITEDTIRVPSKSKATSHTNNPIIGGAPYNISKMRLQILIPYHYPCQGVQYIQLQGYLCNQTSRPNPGVKGHSGWSVGRLAGRLVIKPWITPAASRDDSTKSER